MLNDHDFKILQIVMNEGQTDLETIKKRFWESLDEGQVLNISIGERITNLYLKEYIRKSASYGGYSLTRKGKRLLSEGVYK